MTKTQAANRILTCYLSLALLALSPPPTWGADSSAPPPAAGPPDTQAASTQHSHRPCGPLGGRAGGAPSEEAPAAGAEQRRRQQQQDQQDVNSAQRVERLEQLHRLMSEQDLRRTFQVDSHDQVPEYQILKLTVSRDGSHLISPISDLGELTGGGRRRGDPAPTPTAPTNQSPTPTSRASHNPVTPTSGQQQAPSAATTRTSAQDDLSRHKREANSESGAPARTPAEQRPVGERPDQAAGSPHTGKLIVMNLSTFGRDFKLRLKRNSDFQQRLKDMKMFLAESTGDGRLRYTEIRGPHANHTQPQPQPQSNGTAKSGAPPAPGEHSDIGHTYHDEHNLAALLIEHDRLTGRIQVDGTIGNDFVIKPVPRAALEALAAQHNRKREASADGSPADLERAPSSANSAQANNESAKTNEPRPDEQSNQVSRSAADVAAHLHDDDPHDDDEMFLDEDEALEMAHQKPGADSKSQPEAKEHSGQQQQQQQQPRPLSKAASERKWKKYRKLLAQTQVPKQAQQHQQPEQPAASSKRARRQAPSARPQGDGPAQLELSHHIVFKLKPSSEASSSEHKHSFMLAPGQQTMEEMARRFPLGKRSTADNALDGSPAAGRLSQDHFSPLDSLTDLASDPLGGQFYLEPGLETGVARAGLADWRLVAPYAINETSAAGHQQQPRMRNQTTSGAHARFKRHAGGRPMRGARGPAQANRRHKRQAPDVVWPEVLLVVDYDSFLLHGGDSREVKRYFVSFWNGVDLRYKLLVNPHIRISLAGMIVAKDRDATPYLERNRLRAPNADAVDAAGALTDMGKYLYREDRLPTYDLAVVITKLDMCRRRYEGGRCNRGTAGFAYVGGACVVNKRLEKVNSVAIIEDSGGFSGIIVAAHEVGHLLGCVHDGSPPPSYLGGPGATHCPWEDGFIMSDLRHTERGFRWSQCSVEQFKHFLNGETATCLYNYPHETGMLHRLLPGSMLSLDDQCKRDRGTNACFKDARVCAQLFCFDSASGYCVSYRPAAEGSPCGDGHVCRNGKCVGEIENIIPDYTHQTQTVVAANRPQRPLVVAPGVGHPAARLADNGLSASSTSTATQSPDGGAPAKPAGSAAATAPQIDSRMDTFPVDTPLVGGYSPPLYNPDTHYTPAIAATAATRTRPYAGAHQHQPAMRSTSAKLTAASQFGGRNSHLYSTSGSFGADFGALSTAAAMHSASSVAPPPHPSSSNLAPKQQQQQPRAVAKRQSSTSSATASRQRPASSGANKQTGSSNLFLQNAHSLAAQAALISQRPRRSAGQQQLMRQLVAETQSPVVAREHTKELEFQRQLQQADRAHQESRALMAARS